MSEHILWIDAPGTAGDRRLGGKFANLAEMVEAGIDVPPGFGITTDAYRSFMAAAGLAEQAAATRQAASGADLSTIERLSAEMAEAFDAAPMPAAVEDAILAAYAELGARTGTSDTPVAVRSSGESEDLAGASFAGQYDTYLWISGTASVLAHVRRCWAGMFGPQVLTYQSGGAEATADSGICVGIQQMVPARAAGVMFTLDPISGDRSKAVIEACWGLGEGVVSGAVTPSRFVVDKVTGERTATTVATQEEMIALDPTTGLTGLVAVAHERHSLSSLEDAEITALVALGKRIERYRGAPQDIEWAVSDSGEVRVLQVRPETVWSSRAAEQVVAAPARRPIDHVLARFAGTGVARVGGPAGS